MSFIFVRTPCVFQIFVLCLYRDCTLSNEVQSWYKFLVDTFYTMLQYVTINGEITRVLPIFLMKSESKTQTLDISPFRLFQSLSIVSITPPLSSPNRRGGIQRIFRLGRYNPMLATQTPKIRMMAV